MAKWAADNLKTPGTHAFTTVVTDNGTPKLNLSDQSDCSGAPDMIPGLVSWNELLTRDPEGS